MASFSLMPEKTREKRTYTFVNGRETHHRRWHGIRACEACRRRKIKCDGVKTNNWPCSSCTRRKVHCRRMSSPHGAGTSNASTIAADDTSGQSLEMHTQPQIAMAEEPSEAAIHDAEGSTNDFWQLAPSRNFMQQESDTAFTLSHVLGPFAIDVTGTAPYLRSNVDTRQGEVPVIEDFDEHESLLPIIMPTPGRKVSIPLEMMPDEETALRYFDLYFTHVHPYVPVLSKGIFYQQWYTDRESISPLILEAIFAISGRLAEESTKGQQWLALFSKHLDYFMDAPRLSTLQALLMILKAREAVTRQGYYYRSWTTVVQCIQMGKDLGLDEHFKHHQAGRPCSHILPDCRLRTQIWRVIFVCEVMVGAPQGRYDHAVTHDLKDLSPPTFVSPSGDPDCYTSYNFTFLAQVARSIAEMSEVHTRLRKQNNCVFDLESQQIEANLTTWLEHLPRNLVVPFPLDGSPPDIPSHFIGNLHTCYYLALLLYHRYMLASPNSFYESGMWKYHAKICHSSAQALCRLQEATVDKFSLAGLQCMQGGLGFSVYCSLSCIAFYLDLTTSSDPDFNMDASKHLKKPITLVEAITEIWPMPELGIYINNLREIFLKDEQTQSVPNLGFSDGDFQFPGYSSLSGAEFSSSDINQPLNAFYSQRQNHTNYSTMPPIYSGAMDRENALGNVPSLIMMPQGVPVSGLPQTSSSESPELFVAQYL